ncbi:hypothetical protein [Dyella sp.]|nr:hypothetical protein [Dyella sp.]HKT29998.1 hypothetical protein [Dyella sp.]
MRLMLASSPLAVIPAKAGIHIALMQKAKMDSRFRGNDGRKEASIEETH